MKFNIYLAIINSKITSPLTNVNKYDKNKPVFLADHHQVTDTANELKKLNIHHLRTQNLIIDLL